MSAFQFPYQLRPAATPFWFDKASTPSLAETLHIFKPIIEGIHSLRGEVYTVSGYPAFIDHTGQLSRIDHALRGWIDCWKRMDPSMDTSPLSRLAKKLEYGMPLFEEDIEECAANLNKQISRFMVLPTEAILHHAMTEQISIQLEQMGIKEAA